MGERTGKPNSSTPPKLIDDDADPAQAYRATYPGTFGSLSNRRRLLLIAVGWALLACGDDQVPGSAPPPAPAGPLIHVPPASSCPDAGASAWQPTVGTDPLCMVDAPQVSFKRDVARLVACSGEVCHSPWKYASLVGQHSTTCCDARLRVESGHPSESHLVQAIMGTSDCVDRMGTLSDAQIATVIAWICQGANDD